MKFKVNIKARLERHARNSHVFQKSSIGKMLSTYRLVAFFLTIILPIYPAFGFLSGVTESTVGKYDESTILVSYDESSEEDSLYSQESGYLRPNSNLSLSRDRSGMNELIPYTIENGDSFGRIAEKFNISINSIIWANSMSKNTVLKPGAVIKIPPVSGLVYRVQAGETLKLLADKFKVDEQKIREQNRLAVDQELLLDQAILIPGAIRIADIKRDTPAALASAGAAVKWAIAIKALDKKDPSKKSILIPLPPKNKAKWGAPGKDSYIVAYNGKAKGFAWGNCTYYVATHKNVTWRGNANAWLRNAAAAGVSTGTKPAPGAIISLAGGGYNPYYGHVGIVVDVDGDDLIIKDMNYRRLNEVTVRRISSSDRSIRGYIYVD